jgi:hypothetical protein
VVCPVTLQLTGAPLAVSLQQICDAFYGLLCGATTLQTQPEVGTTAARWILDATLHTACISVRNSAVTPAEQR